MARLDNSFSEYKHFKEYSQQRIFKYLFYLVRKQCIYLMTFNLRKLNNHVLQIVMLQKTLTLMLFHISCSTCSWSLHFSFIDNIALDAFGLLT